MRKDPVIYDIGANRGTWTALAKSAFPAATIHSFEPLKELHGDFHAMTSQLTCVLLHPIALGSTRQILPFHVNSFQDTSSMLPLAELGRREWSITEESCSDVEVWDIDSYQHLHGLPEPALMKLDIQGFELECLRGAAKILLKSSPAILAEVSFEKFYENQCLFEDVSGFLGKFGYRLRALGSGTAIGAPLKQCDVLFVKE
jgi:FkbM family methyltransferase